MPEIAGIRYRARKAGATVANVALFLDRCGKDFTNPPDEMHMLEGLESVVLAAADICNLVVKFPFLSTPGASIGPVSAELGAEGIDVRHIP